VSEATADGTNTYMLHLVGHVDGGISLSLQHVIALDTSECAVLLKYCYFKASISCFLLC